MILTITMNPAIDTLYLMDNFQLGNVHRTSTINKTAGGKGLNVSRVANMLGEKVTASGIIGGSAGEFIINELNKLHINPNFLQIDESSRICLNIIDQTTSISTEILESGPCINQSQQEKFFKLYEQELPKCDIVTTSGSLPLGIKNDFYAKLILLAKKYKKKFILDTSGEAFKQALSSSPYIIKPNDDEIAAFLGKEKASLDDCIEAIRKFKKFGIALPIISLGKKGCIAGLSDGIYHFSSQQNIDVINTVGSGDSFIAGCSVGLVRKLSEPDTIILGMACGMANTQFIDTGKVTQELIDQYMKVITYKKLTN